MLSFSEDLLPRHFPLVHLPKSAKQLDQTAVTVPKPTLPSVSLIFSNENNVYSQPSFRKWKNQQHARLENDRAKQQATKKHVRFENVSQENHSWNIGRCFHVSRQEPTDDAEATSFEMNFRQYDRAPTSELIKEDCFSRPFCMSRENQHRFDSNKSDKMTQQKATDAGFRFDEQQRKKFQSRDEILLNILEEQQRHISFQQKQILMNEKKNLEQKKQICILQRRIRHLLLRNETDDTLVQRNGPRLPTENESTSMDMTNESMDLDGGMSRFIEDEKNAMNFANVKWIPNIGILSSDGTLRGGVHPTKNSSAILNSSSHSDVNITAEAFIYKVSTNSSYVDSYRNSPKVATDRSYMLNMLGMKYKCSEDDGMSSGTEEESFVLSQSDSIRNYQISENVPLDMNDYLVRHGLIKRQNI